MRALADELRELAPGLGEALRGLESEASGLTAVERALAELRDDAAHRWLAVALLAEEVAEAGSETAT